MALPKYIQNANRIIDVLAEQPDKVWKKTQRELGEKLGFSQPELSNLLSSLAETGKIRKGDPLPGVRGRNYSLELVDATHLEGPIARKVRHQEEKDRVLAPHEAVTQPVDLQAMTLEQVGAAVIRTLQTTWEKAERASRLSGEQMARIREMREQLQEERQFRTRYATEKEKLERSLQDKDSEISRMRGEINTLIVKASQRKQNGNGGYQVKDLLDDDELRMLSNLMKDKPGFYRESDQEVGLKAG